MAYARRDFSGSAVTTTLTAGIDADDTSFVLTSATGWPTGSDGNFLARIGSETILCASRSGSTVTVASSGRGYEGTTAAAHTTAETVSHTAGMTDYDEANEVVYEILGDGSAWTAYTPTWTGLSIGNGTNSALYVQLGKIVHVGAVLILGSTSTVTGPVTMSLPVSITGLLLAVTVSFQDASAGTAGYFSAVGEIASGSVIDIHASGASLSATVPFTWTTGDRIRVTAIYEAA